MQCTLSKKQKEIIDLIYRYRFLTRHHIQQFLYHKTPTQINLWLKDLTNQNYLYRHYTKTFGENMNPALYYLAPNGIRYIRTVYHLSREQIHHLYYEKHRTPQFQTHCLILADFACNLISYAHKQEQTATSITRVAYAQEDNEKLSLLKILNPDAYYTYTGTGIAKAAFVEIIDENTKEHDIRKKITTYANAWQEGEEVTLEQERFPSLLWLVPNEKKLRQLKRIIISVKHAYEDEALAAALRCNIALVADIQTQSLADPIWTKA